MIYRNVETEILLSRVFASCLFLKLQVFKIVSNLTQENQKLATLFAVQILNGEHCQAFALAMESSMDGVSSTCQLKPHASPICLLILLYTQ